MRFELPSNWTVRYDYHEHPRGISAVVRNSLGYIHSVGFAKYNPNDPQFSEATGKQIALGRALAGRSRMLTSVELERGRSRMLTSVELERLGASLADELLASG